MSSGGASAVPAPAWHVSQRTQNFLVEALTVWGGALIFLENVPLLQVTMIGNLLRVALLLVGVGLTAMLLPRIAAALNGIEVLFMGLFCCLVIFAGIVAFARGEVTSPYAAVQFMGLTLLVYVAGKGLDSEAALERYFRILYWIAFFSSAQAIIAFIGNFAGYRRIGLVGFDSGLSGYMQYSFFGLLGGYWNSLRILGYFSEPSHFAQTLLPMFFYAVACRRKIGQILIPLGMVTTAALASLGPAVLLFAAYSLRRKRIWPLLPVLGFVVLFFIPDTAVLLENLFHLYNRAGSYGERQADYNIAMDVLLNNPFGLGLVDLHRINIVQSPNSGLAVLILQFGALVLPFVLFIMGFLALVGLGFPRLLKISPLCLGLLGTSMATISAGPWFKYWMVFMLSALVTAIRLETAKRHSGGAPPSADFSPGPGGSSAIGEG